MKTFLNARWEIKEENIHEKYKFISTSKNKLNNVIKDINSLIYQFSLISHEYLNKF